MGKHDPKPDLDQLWLDAMDELPLIRVFDRPARIDTNPMSDIVAPIVAGLFVFGLAVFWLETR